MVIREGTSEVAGGAVGNEVGALARLVDAFDVRTRFRGAGCQRDRGLNEHPRVSNMVPPLIGRLSERPRMCATACASCGTGSTPGTAGTPATALGLAPG